MSGPFEAERHGDVMVVTLEGDLDATALEVLERRLPGLLARMTHVVFDLAAVGVLPSMGAGFLLRQARTFRERGGRVVLARVPRRVEATLETLGLDGVLRAYPDTAAALAALRPSEPSDRG